MLLRTVNTIYKSMGHLYHGYVSHNQMVIGVLNPMFTWGSLGQSLHSLRALKALGAFTSDLSPMGTHWKNVPTGDTTSLKIVVKSKNWVPTVQTYEV